MSLSNSRRSTDRIRRNKDDSSTEAEGSSRRSNASSSNDKNSEASAPSSSTKRVATTANEKANSSGADSKRTLTPDAKTTSSKTNSNSDERPKVSTISKRQQVVPAAEAKKPSARLPAAEPKKVSGRIAPVAAPKSTDESKKTVSKVPIKPLDDGKKSVSDSKRAAASLETNIVKPKDVSASTRKKMSETNEVNEPEATPKSSTKRSRAGTNNSGRSPAGKSGRSAGRGGAFSNKKNNMIYAIMGGVLLILVGMILFTLAKGPRAAKVITKQNDVHKGYDMCEKAIRTYGGNASNAPEALKQLEEGINVLQPALDKMRLPDGNLPSDYAGHDTKLAQWLAFRKTLRDQSMMENARRERN